LAHAGSAFGRGGAALRDGPDHRYYLSLGDSLSTGVQPIGPEDFQFRTSEGFADQLLDIARERLDGLELVNLGYPGESTTTMLDGSLCSYPHGSQLKEAVAFLRTHRGRVAFVTLDVGGNDVTSPDEAGVAAAIETLARNLPGIAGRLRGAAGPEVPIAAMTLYDPALAAWLQGPVGRERAVASLKQGLEPINAVLSAIYGEAGIAVADVAAAFETSEFETLVHVDGLGPVPRNVARILEWTWAAAPPPLGPDSHPNAVGYRVIAETFARVLSGLRSTPDAAESSTGGRETRRPADRRVGAADSERRARAGSRHRA
jgi:lysophospholipase L1-like esterase